MFVWKVPLGKTNYSSFVWLFVFTTMTTALRWGISIYSSASIFITSLSIWEVCPGSAHKGLSVQMLQFGRGLKILVLRQNHKIPGTSIKTLVIVLINEYPWVELFRHSLKCNILDCQRRILTIITTVVRSVKTVHHLVQ